MECDINFEQDDSLNNTSQNNNSQQQQHPEKEETEPNVDVAVSLHIKDFNSSDSKLNFPLALHEQKESNNDDNDNDDELRYSLLKELEDKWAFIEQSKTRHKNYSCGCDNMIVDSTSFKANSLYYEPFHNWKNVIDESKKKYYNKKTEQSNIDKDEFNEYIKTKTKQLQQLRNDTCKNNSTDKNKYKIGNKFNMINYNKTLNNNTNTNSYYQQQQRQQHQQQRPSFLKTIPNCPYKQDNNNNKYLKHKQLNYGTCRTEGNNNNNNGMHFNKQSNSNTTTHHNKNLILKIKDVYNEITEIENDDNSNNNKSNNNIEHKKTEQIKDLSLVDLNKNFDYLMEALSPNKKHSPLLFFSPRNNTSYQRNNKCDYSTDYNNNTNNNTNSSHCHNKSAFSISTITKNRIQSKINENNKLISELLPTKPIESYHHHQNVNPFQYTKRRNNLFKPYNNTNTTSPKANRMYNKNIFTETEKKLLRINSPTLQKIIQQ